MLNIKNPEADRLPDPERFASHSHSISFMMNITVR